MVYLFTDADAAPRALPPTDPFAAIVARRSRIDQHLRRNARRKQWHRVVKDATLAVLVSAAAFAILQLAVYQVR